MLRRVLLPIAAALLLAAVLAFALTRPAHAQWPTDPAVDLPVCTAAGAQDQSVLRASGNHIWMVWRDGRNAGTKGTDIYAQRFSLDGVPQWTANGIAVCDTALNQFSPAVAPLGDNLLVAWSDDRNGDVYAQLLDPAGNRLWEPDGRRVFAHGGIVGELRLTDTFRYVDAQPRPVLMLAVQVSYFGYTLLYGQRIEEDGSLPWGLAGVEVVPGAVTGRIWATSRRDSSATFSFTSGGSIVSQRLALDGARPWGNGGVVFATASTGGTGSIGSYLASSGATWNNDTFGLVANGSPIGSGTTDDIWMQRLDPAGNKLMGPSGITVCAAPSAQADMIGYASSGQATQSARVYWSDLRSGDWRLYAQHIDAGVPSLAIDGVRVCTAESKQDRPRYLLGYDFGAPYPTFTVLAWRDGRGGIYAQAMADDGTLLWDPAGVPVSSSASAFCQELGFQRIVLQDFSVRFVVSHWRPSGSGDLYLKSFNATGAFGNASVESAVAAPGPRLAPVAPNPLRGAGTLRFALPRASHARLELLDVTGRRVRLLADGPYEAGPHEVRLDAGASLPSGLYWARLTAGERSDRTKVLVVR